jgi:predicted lipoprotein with Yx(FWY)xxD motif
MTSRRRFALAIASGPILAIALAACGSSNNNSSSDTTASTASPPASTTSSSSFSVKSVAGVGQILVDASGNALYTNDQDSAGSVKCTGECAAVWVPLVQGGKPVTSGGQPLYTFVQDSPGKVTGDGVTDNFGGVSFTWTLAKPSSASSSTTTTTPNTSTPSGSTSTPSGSSSSSGSSGGGGYGY